MKKLELQVRMTKAEFDAKNVTCEVCEGHKAYAPGQIIFTNGDHYINVSKTNCTFSKSTGCWKQVVVTDGTFTKGNQDRDENGQPYTATNPAPDAD